MSQVEKTKRKTGVRAEVAYLPATEEFEKQYERDTMLSTVLAEAMAFFGVSNYTDRDVHEFHLEHEGNRVDYSQTLGALADKGSRNDKGKQRKRVHLDLVEQVTAGGV